MLVWAVFQSGDRQVMVTSTLYPESLAPADSNFCYRQIDVHTIWR